MNIVEEIKTKRCYGAVHCGYLSSSLPLAEVARAFSLSPDAFHYHEISSSEAIQILTVILHRDLAYSSEIMPEEMAAGLSDLFLREFKDESASFFTNAVYNPSGYKNRPQLSQVTNVTFDAGVIAISKNNCACLWVEDED